MINKASQLSEKIFDEEVPQKPSRDGYGDGVVAAGEKDPNVVVLCADLKESTRSLWFEKKFPDRFVEMGVAEQNMAAVAAGMALTGKIPFISSYAMFSPGRNWEQIRTTTCYNNANVKIIGAHSGVSVGPDGATHQAVEDMAIMRALPNMTVVAPCDATEGRKAVIEAAKMYGPVYIRFTREKTPLFTTDATPFEIGKAEIFWLSKKPEVAIIACGPLLHNAMRSAHELERDGISVMVINNHTIKPIDEKKIIEAAKKCGAVVTVEEHQVMGGLGSAAAEVLAKNYPVPMEFIGMQDTFGESGPPNALIEKYGMGVKNIKTAVKRVIKRKGN